MLTLSLLLGAAAGVNALAGGGVTGVTLSDGLQLCPDNCHHKGVFLSATGYYCAIEEIIHRVRDDGTDDRWYPYACPGATLPDGYTERPLRDGEKPSECWTTTSELGCLATTNRRGHPKVIKWSEVVEELKKAKAQNAQSSPEKPSAAPEKPVNCADEGSKAFRKCQEEKVESFSECNQRGIEAIEACNQK
ncbi:uncharacterized protein BBA_06198 [Beauveria bassiana ARSEF 2860]|uniref:Uncharacterized protein n=1 Tax=Beauveria bassiana (strain ARSEF 2860) TaxID=655819 RepID=J5JH77_BEAB2|nr:uncharacterized protein BBA_06198 [Beauveria bassiana ARSEF 2860]EJP65023.1 hypothetical protein BBA_06198 [Beauveria bassiana ARSEF 2860]